jgi:hypothetical protein
LSDGVEETFGAHWFAGELARLAQGRMHVGIKLPLLIEIIVFPP